MRLTSQTNVSFADLTSDPNVSKVPDVSNRRQTPEKKIQLFTFDNFLAHRSTFSTTFSLKTTRPTHTHTNGETTTKKANSTSPDGANEPSRTAFVFRKMILTDALELFGAGKKKRAGKNRPEAGNLADGEVWSLASCMSIAA